MKSPLLFGIVNLTPDSFSGDGRMGDAALAHAAQLVAQGAEILDIGAESTRPGATPLDAAQEWARLEPFLREAQSQEWRMKIRLGVDTRHAQTAARALVHGVDIVNDVSGLRDPAMADVLRAASCDIVVMHALTIPADPAQLWPKDIDPVAAILAWKNEILARITAIGIAPERLIFDPGIGFGKTSEQSLRLILDAPQLVASGGRWLFGHSRKSFLKLFKAADMAERDALTLAFSAQLAAARVDYLRVHDIDAHRTLFEAICI